MTKIVIGIPISRLFDWRTNLAQIYAVVDVMAAGYNLELITEGSHERPTPIVEARNRITAKALEHGADYLLWLDSDATAKRGMLSRLLSRDVPIVSALCFKRKYPVTPACGRKDTSPGADPMDYPPPMDDVAAWVQKHNIYQLDDAALLPDTEDALLPVDVVGTHYTLIQREVLEALPPPWYKRTTPPDYGSTGSDWWFCQQAQRAGFASYVDMTVISGHLEGSHVISVNDFSAWSIAIRYSEYANQQKGEK